VIRVSSGKTILKGETEMPSPAGEDPREELFAKLAAELGGEFVNEEGWRFDKVRVDHGAWSVTLEFHTHGGYRSESIYTRFRAPIPPTDFRFRVFEQTLLTQAAHIVGMQDIRVGDDEFDSIFVVQGTDRRRTKRLFAGAEVRRIFASEPEIEAAINVTPVSPPAMELSLEVPGRVEDGTRLRRLYDAFAGLMMAALRG
jgi:hypothetical protein